MQGRNGDFGRRSQRADDLVVWFSIYGQATDRSIAMPINWADIPWTAVGLLAALTFVSSLIGHSLTRNAFVGAIIAVIIFVAVYVFWDFYPHGLVTTLRFPTRT
jgi:hypothetical protein